MSSENEITMKKDDDGESARKYWEQTIQQINANSPAYTLNEEQLKALVAEVKKIQVSVFTHDTGCEPFFTSLITYCAYSILDRIETYSHDQVIDLEPICHILMKYYLNYLRNNQSKEKTMSSYQVILIIESLLTSKSLSGVFKASITTSSNTGHTECFNRALIDLPTLVTLLTSSKPPKLTNSKPKNSVKIDMPEVGSQQSFSEPEKDQFSMENLIRSFLNQNFTQSATQSMTSIEKQSTSKLSERSFDEMKSSLPNSYLTRPAKELFSHYTKKYFHLYNGIKLVFDECESSVTYLNSFRQNRLKQVLAKKFDKFEFTVDEAKETKKKTRSLSAELNLLHRCLNLPVFNLMTAETSSQEIDEAEQNSNFLIRAQLDKEFIRNISELVQTAQILTLSTCASELTLTNENNETVASTEAPIEDTVKTVNSFEELLTSNESYISLAKQSISIFDRFQIITNQLDTNLTRNINVQCAFLMGHYLNTFHLHHIYLLKSKLSVTTCDTPNFTPPKHWKADSDIKITSSLDHFAAKLVVLFKQIFFNKPMQTENVNEEVLDMSSFDMGRVYSNEDLLILFARDGCHMFKILLDYFHLTHCKYKLVSLIKKNVIESQKTVENAMNSGMTKEGHWIAENGKCNIKNIDDPSSEEETTSPAINPDETDDFLLIGSWFDDQLNTDTTSNPTLATNPSNTNATVDITNCTDMNLATTTDRISSGILSHCIDSSSATQILDTTFELEQSTSQNSNNFDLIIEMIDLIMKLVKTDDAEQTNKFKEAFIECLDKERIDQSADMIKEIESNDQLFPDRFIAAYYKFIQFQIVKSILDNEKQLYLLEAFCADKPNQLDVKKNYLALKFQIFVLKLSTNNKKLLETAKVETLSEWTGFLDSIQIEISKTFEGSDLKESLVDISMEQMAFKLFLFYYLENEHRQEVISKITGIFNYVHQNLMKIKDARVYGPIYLVTRVLMMFDYLVRNWSKPTSALMTLIEFNLLNITVSSETNADEFTLCSFENMLSIYNSSSSECTKVQPTFYSFTSNKILDFVQQQASNSQPSIGNEHLFNIILDIVDVYLSNINYQRPSKNVAIGYNFIYSWSLLEPLSGPLKPAKKFFTSVIESIFNSDLSLKESTHFESNLKIALLFRSAFRLVNVSEWEEQIVGALWEISGGSTLESPRRAFEFFHKFWTRKFAAHMKGSAEDFLVLNRNIELLNFHVKLLHEKFFEQADKVIDLELSNAGAETAQLRNNCIELIVTLIKAFKNGYKNFVLLESLKQSDTTLSQLDISLLSLISNASSLNQSLPTTSILTPTLVNLAIPRNQANKLTRTHSSTTPMTNSATNLLQRSMSNDSNKPESTIVGELNRQLKQINCLDATTSCLIQLNKLNTPILTQLTNFLNEDDAKLSRQTDAIQLNSNERNADFQLAQSFMCRSLNNDTLYPLILSTLCKFLNELFSSASNLTLFKQVEGLFIDLNGDLTCCRSLGKHVLQFFNSPVTVKVYSQRLRQNEFDIYFNNMSSKYKYECILLATISSHTYEIIYKLATTYYLNGAEASTVNQTYDSMFQELMDYVDKSLDTPYGIQGFCEFFAKTTSDDAAISTNKSDLIENAGNKFLIFFTTSSKANSSRGYFFKMLTIINKLFRINFAYSHKADAVNTFHTKLTSVIGQLNALAGLSPEFLQRWLAKLVLPNEAEEKFNEEHRFVLRQLAVYLVNEKNSLVGEGVTLSVLSAFIQSASKLINEHSSAGLPELISLMNLLSSAGSGYGHLYLFQACCLWLEYYPTIDIEKLVQKSDYQILKDPTSVPTSDTLIVQSACYILTYVCEILGLLKSSSRDNSSQFLASIDTSVPKEFNRFFQQNLCVDFNQDFDKMIEFIRRNDEAVAAKQANAKNGKKPIAKRRINTRLNNRRGSRYQDDKLKSVRKSNLNGSSTSLFDNDTNDNESPMDDQDLTADDYETNDQLDLDDFTDDDEHTVDPTNDTVDDNTDNEDFDAYYDDDQDEDDDDDEEDDDDEDDDDDDDAPFDDTQAANAVLVSGFSSNQTGSTTAGKENDYDYYAEDDNFSDNPLAQSSTATQPVILGVGSDLTTTVTRRQSTIRSSNTFNLNPDDLFEEEADYAEDDDEDEDEDEDDEDDDLNAGQMATNISDSTISRQSSSADVTSSVLASSESTDRRTIEYFEIDREDNDNEEDDEEDDDDDEYGDDFNDNFVVDYENVDRRTLIKELVNASNALAATSTKPNNLTGIPASADLSSFATSSLGDTTSREAIYQDLMSTISAAASTISNRLQNQVSTSSTSSLLANNNNPVQASDNKKEDPKPVKTSVNSIKTKSTDKDTEDDLTSKLCTFTATKKEFMNQHWYYCHTCNMVDRIGVCTICAKVCHADHDISYAKYGSFFCDCGAKEDGSCQALHKRPAANPKSDPKKVFRSTNRSNKTKKSNSIHNSDAKNCNRFKNFLSSNIPTESTIALLKRIHLQTIANKPKQLEKLRPQLIECIKSKNLLTTVKRLLDTMLIPTAKQVYDNSLLNTDSLTARRLLAKFKKQEIIMPTQSGEIKQEAQTTQSLVTEQQPLFVVTLGSQEGAFENVRMTYAGDHGPTIKQLIHTHAVRRTSMCCVSSKTKKHLIVTHEKGKSSHFTVLQLNALLKQDSNKRNKLTLTKLNTIPVPFTLLSVVANENNEDYVALTGLKDCCAMYLNENGQTKQEIAQQQNVTSANGTPAQAEAAKTSAFNAPGVTNSGLIVLHPSLESSNYIIKSIWLPGSKSELAVVTCDLIKIYDLAIDKISPMYYYLLPMGKIKDVTFVYHTLPPVENNSVYQSYSQQRKFIVIMSSCGYLYYEELNEISSAKNGIYYVTNTIDCHYEQNEVDKSIQTATPANTTNMVFGGGVSVYYSFKLGLLFWSFQHTNKTFIGSFKDNSLVIDRVFSLYSPTNAFKASPGANSISQALCNWNEIPSHPGLVMAMTYLSNNPVVLMLLPDKVYVQEIKLMNSNGGPSKAKIQDMVATRHQASSVSESSGELTKSEVAQPEAISEIDVGKEMLTKTVGFPTVNSEKTTMIILCDDGSLKIYVADSEKTEYWLQPHLQATNAIAQLRNSPMWSSVSLFQLCPSSIFNVFNAVSETSSTEAIKLETSETANNQEDKDKEKPEPMKSRVVKQMSAAKKKSTTAQVPVKATKFPIDYFEKSTQLNDVEYGGNDLLEVYNQQQLKTRLSMGGNKFVCSTKPNGFTLEIRNKSDSGRSLLIGCRILLGTHSLERVPLHFTVFNRKLPVKITRQRWFDICLTREEAILADNFISIQVGASSDLARHITVIDGCVCYVRTRESLNWSKLEAQLLQRRHQDSQQRLTLKANTLESKKTIGAKLMAKSEKKLPAAGVNCPEKSWLVRYKPKPFDSLLGQTLDILENCVILLNESQSAPYSISIDLLSLVCPPVITFKAKSLLYNILTLSSATKDTTPLGLAQLYNSYNDDALLSLISNTFQLKSIKLSADLSSYFTTFNSYLDQLYDLETLEKTLVVCKSLIQQQRANNLIKYLNDKFNLVTNGQRHFINALNELFWRVLNRYVLSMSQIGQPEQIINLNLIIETLVEVMHTYLMVELTLVNEKNGSLESFANSTIFNTVFECYMKLLCNDLILDINFITRRMLLQLLKMPSASTKPKPSLTTTTKTSGTLGQFKFTVGKQQSQVIQQAPIVQASMIIPELTNEPVTLATSQVDEPIRFPIPIVSSTEDASAVTNQSVDNPQNPSQPANPTQDSTGTSLNNFFYNEDEEMLQLAMQLSLNEANEAAVEAAAASTTALPLAPNPPVILPRTSTSSSTNLASFVTEPTEPAAKTPMNLAPVVFPTAQYLQNTSAKLLQLRKVLLEKFSQNIELSVLGSFSRLPARENTGLRLVAFFQCMLNLLSELSAQDEHDRQLLDNIIHSLLNILKPLKTLANKLNDLDESGTLNLALADAGGQTETPIYVRTEEHDVQLLVLRTISILLSKSKYQRSGDNCNFIIQTLVKHLCQFNLIDMCQNLMKLIYFEYWRKMPTPDTNDLNVNSVQSQGLMKFSNESKYYEELAPYFVKDPLNKDSFLIPAPNLLTVSETQSSKQALNLQQPTNLFDNYTELLTEILIRLPYQMKKLCLSTTTPSVQSVAETATNQYQQNLYQITTMFEFSAWTHYLCEYLLLPQCYYLKRLIKKLLQILCGSKEKYRKFKDQHILITSIRCLVGLCALISAPSPTSMLSMGNTINSATEALSVINEVNSNIDSNLLSAALSTIKMVPATPTSPKLSYSHLLKLVENLKVILEVASSRTVNWQRFCGQNPSTILYLIELALLMGVDSNGTGSDSSSLSGGGSIAAASTSAIIPTILQIVLCTLGGTKQKPPAAATAGKLSNSQTTVNNNSTTTTTTTTSNQKTSKKTSFTTPGAKLVHVADENLCGTLVSVLFKTVSKDILYKFIRTYLLEAANANVRWTLHTLLYSVFKNAATSNQELLYEILIQLWPDAMTTYGVKASQYVDLLGYILVKISPSTNPLIYENAKMKEFLQRVVELFQYQNMLLATHPNSTIYNTLTGLMPEFEGIYLEPDPCFICNNIETPIMNFKLSSIKSDSRYTTNQQIFKLNGTYSLTKILIKVSEIRKSKMVSALNVYYTNKAVHSIVDLKMNHKLWLKARRVTVTPGQQELKIDFQLPIIACNLMIEYIDFYDRDAQATTETAVLQCPRCSASVPAHPGVCNTCGENVFQCHKCRSINYDERDPFLCNSCGFCKFAKFEFTLVGRNCCAVDPIECEDDRKQTLLQISSLLERADKIYYTLSQHTKPTLESMIIKLNEQSVYEKFTNATGNENGQLVPTTNSSGIIGIKVSTLNNAQSTTTQTPTATASGTSAPSATHSNKTTQSIVQKYTVECKSKFDELAKIILKLNLCRKELREYDKQFKSTESHTNPASANLTRKNSIAPDVTLQQQKIYQQQQQQQRSSVASSMISIQGGKVQQQIHARNTCFGCASASVDHCITLFRVLLCSNNVQTTGQAPSNLLVDYVKSELCRQGILEELINFNLKRSILFTTLPTSPVTTVPSTTTAAAPPTAAQVVAASNPNQPPASGSAQPSTTASTAAAAATTTTTTANPAQSALAAAASTSPTQRTHDRDLINLIFLLVKNHPEGSEKLQKLILKKLEAFLTPMLCVGEESYSENSCLSVVSSLFQVSGGSAVNSPLKYEMLLLSALMQKQQDTCWEQRLRLVIHILLRSLHATESSHKPNSRPNTNNPILMECLTLPCLRIINHICKTTTNLNLLSSLASTPASKPVSFKAQSPTMSSVLRPSLFQTGQIPGNTINLNRFYSEPHDINYAQSPHQMLNNNYLLNAPGTCEIDVLNFLQSKNGQSYYEKWLSNKYEKNEDYNVLVVEGKEATVVGGERENMLNPPPQVLSPQVFQLKSKYFAAWRKYTLKKRKQQQIMQQLQQQNAILESKLKPVQSMKPCQTNKESSPCPPSTTQPSPPQPSLPFDYDLKSSWLKQCIFCPSSRAVRQLAVSILQNLFNFHAGVATNSSTNEQKKFQLAEILSQFLEDGTAAGESFAEYLNLFKQVINDKECKYRLVLNNNILTTIERLLHREIKQLSDLERLSELSSRPDRFTLLLNSPYALSLSYMSTSTNLNYGYSVRSLTELLALFLKEANIKNKYKGRLIATVLNSYLSLKKLVYQRTKLVEEAQEKLLNTLEQMTSGTDAETRKFMSICIETVSNFDLDDLVTPVFIFERLCNIIYPEEIVDNKEFLMVLEKDPNQEDYLQGRMLGNPYSSNEPSLGPLMRNVKNKICTDCELIALLEDDNGMELLVNNKIISLDLPVRDVFKKVWLTEVLSEHDPMRIVYRMTGLSGDATEDIIDNLDSKGNDQAKDDEDIYRMANELASSGALDVMLERLASITQQNFTLGKPLLSVLLKLFDYALKLRINRQYIIRPEMKTITTMLQTLNMMLKIEQIEPNKIGVSLAEQLLNIMECILSEASKQPADIYSEFSSLCGDTEQLEFLLNNIKCTFVCNHPILLQALMKLIPYISFGDEKKMHALISYFSTYFTNFDRFDELASNTDTAHEHLLHLECFCVIVNGIEHGAMGTRLRDMMHEGGVSLRCIEYLLRQAPPITTYLNSDFELWRTCIERRSLPYVLRILTGLCRSHQGIQDLIGESCIPRLHKLEQFSSGNLVGVLAEDLLVALKQNPSSKVAAAIEEVRNQTKLEKKKLAMAKRQKQLAQLGMRANDKGQLVTSDPAHLKNMTDFSEVEEEKGHVCCICREGYKYHPHKVLAIYTFSKKTELEHGFEARARKTTGYSTVTHFNLVHIDCHTNAIRSARTCRDEWENAALQNANTKCNGILPLWGPEVAESLFSNALARHNNYLLEATGIRESTHMLSVHDLKLLLGRFAENLSFSEDSGGGGRDSNINLVPYMIHSVLYAMNTAKYVVREERNLTTFLETKEKLISNSFECDNVFYYLSMSLIIMKPAEWKVNRIKFLHRLILTAHARLVNTPSLDKQKLTSTTVQDFKKYKPSLLFIGLIELFQKHLCGKVKPTEASASDQPWTEMFIGFIRHNDQVIMEACRRVLKDFEEDLIVCETWEEMFDVLGYLDEISDPQEFLKAFLSGYAK